MVDSQRNLRLTPRDRLIFEHVLRYGLTTIDATHRLFFDVERSKPEAARSTLRRLADGKYVSDIREPWQYYRLTATAVEVLEPLLEVKGGTYRAASGPLVSLSVLERLTIMRFSCLGTPQRRVLLQHEFHRHFGAYVQPNIPAWPYYIESLPQGAVLHLVMVDSRSGISEQVERVTKQQQRRMAIPGFRELDLRGRFRVTLLTALDQRAEELRLALDDAHVTGVIVEVVPQVASLFTDS